MIYKIEFLISSKSIGIFLFLLYFFLDAVKMQHWQVEDYTDLNTDIENSLNLNTNDLVGNTYTVR